MPQKNLFIKFTTCQSLYYISNAAMFGFAALFLQTKGFSNTEIGLFFACSSVICIILQSLYGSFLDRHPAVSAKSLIAAVTIIIIADTCLLSASSGKVLIFVSYTIINSIMLVTTSLFNSFGMEYLNSGASLNYSLSRGLGSFFYAVSSFSIGILVKHFTVSSIIPICILAQGLLFLCLMTLRPARHAGCGASSESIPVSSGNLFSFLRRNPRLLFLFLSILLVYTSFTSVLNFHINIIEAAGGGSTELGISTSIAALAELPAMALFLPLSKKFSYRGILRFSCAFFAVKTVLFMLAQTVTHIYMIQCLQFLAYGLFTPASAYYINSILPEQDKAKGQSALGIFTFGLSGLTASMLSGILLDHFSVTTMLLIESGLAAAGVCGVFLSRPDNT